MFAKVRKAGYFNRTGKWSSAGLFVHDNNASSIATVSGYKTPSIAEPLGIGNGRIEAPILRPLGGDLFLSTSELTAGTPRNTIWVRGETWEQELARSTTVAPLLKKFT